MRRGCSVGCAALLVCAAHATGCARGPEPAPEAASSSAPDALEPSPSAARTNGASDASAASAPEPSAAGAASAAAPSSVAVGASASASARPGPASPPITLPSAPVDHDFRADPPVFSAAFDGSLRYSLWLRTMRFARKMKAEHGSMPHLTFFVNAAFYSTEDAPSDVGRAHTHTEVLVRRALTQLAINEGHDIGDHGFGHFDGSRWSREEWDRELDHFHAVMSSAVFEPVRDDEGKALFPVFEPLAGASPREVGAACAADADCDSGMCVEITPETKLCSAACNLSAKCPKGTACGAPMFREDTDVCLPPPRFPLVVDGVTMFDARGEPNPKHPRLRPYPIVGFRAPYLASNDAMYESLLGHGYLFDTSQAVTPAPPYWFSSASPSAGRSRRLLELALMPWPGARAVPMDYNYRLDKAPGARMEADYRAALVAAYDAGHWPWNIGHHFATWEDGEYLDVLERTVDFALSGCPDDAGKARCPGAVVLSSRELAKKLAASAPAPRR